MGFRFNDEIIDNVQILIQWVYKDLLNGSVDERGPINELKRSRERNRGQPMT
jgi:hypothetical protein